MKIQQINNYSFTGRMNPEDVQITIIPDYKNTLERALEKVDFFGESKKPKSKVEKFLPKGHKLKTFFRQDGKTPSYSIEFTRDNKKVHSIYFANDGKKKLLETIYDKLGNAVKSLYYKQDGVTVFMEQIHKITKK